MANAANQSWLISAKQGSNVEISGLKRKPPPKQRLVPPALIRIIGFTQWLTH
jgi:hypothetical protein